MKQKIKWIKIICSLIAMFLVIFLLVRIRFINPDMTDLRLTITYWKEYIIAFIVFGVGYLVISSEFK